MSAEDYNPKWREELIKQLVSSLSDVAYGAGGKFGEIRKIALDGADRPERALLLIAKIAIDAEGEFSAIANRAANQADGFVRGHGVSIGAIMRAKK